MSPWTVRGSSPNAWETQKWLQAFSKYNISKSYNAIFYLIFYLKLWTRKVVHHRAQQTINLNDPSTLFFYGAWSDWNLFFLLCYNSSNWNKITMLVFWKLILLTIGNQSPNGFWCTLKSSLLSIKKCLLNKLVEIELDNNLHRQWSSFQGLVHMPGSQVPNPTHVGKS